MVGRTIESRLQQKRLSRTYGKRLRDTHGASSGQLPASKKPRKTMTQRDLEKSAEVERLNEISATTERNRTNQCWVQDAPDQVSDEAAFFSEIDGPLTKVCAVCGERVTPKATKVVEYDKADRTFRLLEVQSTETNERHRGLVEAGVHFKDGHEYVTLCTRCSRAISRRQIPPFSMASGFCLGPVPQCLARLNPMEARMIGIGTWFTTCYTLGPLGQSATRGNSINFWNDACDVVKKLPRPASRCGVIRLKRPDTRRTQTYYTVRPWYLREALVWLQQHNAIYKDIIVDETLLDSMPAEPDLPEIELDKEDYVPNAQAEGDESEADNTEDSFYESFVLDHEASTQREEEKILDVVIGSDAEEAFVLPAHDHPMNEYETKLLMQSCFPTLFPDGLGGFHPIAGIEDRVHDYKLAEYCSHLMAWHDRRFITHPTFKFFCLNLIQRRQIDGLLKQVRIHPEPHYDNESVQASPIDETHSSNTREKTKTYLWDLKPFFRSVRGTSLYWANVRDDVMAMIGNPAMENRWPTFFVTLSAADTIWPDFFCTCDPNLTFEEAARLSAAKKRKYLNANPDLAAHHFHRRFQAFFRHILCGKSQPLGEIKDFFWRIEFQHRGSPHVHALFWIKDAPDILELSKTPSGLERLLAFADKFVSCFKHLGGFIPRADHDLDPLCERPPPPVNVEERQYDLNRVVERVQQHVCSSRSSCQRNGVCRFNFPKAVREATEVHRVTNGSSVKISFELKRDNDATNNYNPDILAVWRANMDIQIIGNAYGAVEYVAAYVSKAEPDSVRFYRTIEQALDKLPAGMPRERMLKRTANALLAIREVSAQEAVYILSSTLCLYGKSRAVLKVKVSRHDRRFYRVSREQMEGLAIPSTGVDEIRLESIEVAYMQRPDTAFFRDITYREFCELYEPSSEAPTSRQRLERWCRLDGHGYIKAKTQSQIVRSSPRYRTDEADANYCYAQLFLHCGLPRECVAKSEVYWFRVIFLSAWTLGLGRRPRGRRVLGLLYVLEAAFQNV